MRHLLLLLGGSGRPGETQSRGQVALLPWQGWTAEGDVFLQEGLSRGIYSPLRALNLALQVVSENWLIF